MTELVLPVTVLVAAATMTINSVSAMPPAHSAPPATASMTAADAARFGKSDVRTARGTRT